jgi:hypothetical protein
VKLLTFWLVLALACFSAGVLLSPNAPREARIPGCLRAHMRAESLTLVPLVGVTTRPMPTRRCVEWSNPT